MKALVTGGTGFIGNALVLRLREQGWAVYCLCRRNITSFDGGISVLHGDLAHPAELDALKHVINDVDVLYHLSAAIPDRRQDENQTFMTVNVLSTVKLLDIARETGIKSFVYASSLPIIGRPVDLPISERHAVKPLTIYHLSKWFGEEACELFRNSYGVKTTSLRITSPYGPGMNRSTVIPIFISCALDDKPISLHGTGNRVQNFVHVGDAVDALMLAAETEKPGVYNVAGSKALTMRELSETILSVFPETNSAITFSNQPDPQEAFVWDVDMSLTINDLGYRPHREIKQGLAEVIAEMQGRTVVARWWKDR